MITEKVFQLLWETLCQSYTTAQWASSQMCTQGYRKNALKVAGFWKNSSLRARLFYLLINKEKHTLSNAKLLFYLIFLKNSFSKSLSISTQVHIFTCSYITLPSPSLILLLQQSIWTCLNHIFRVTLHFLNKQ